MTSHVLLINCPDEPGLVAKITSTVFEHRLNIISNGEFVEKASNHFFMRTEFAGDFDKQSLLIALKSKLPKEADILLTVRKKRDAVILVTKEYHCLSDLLVRHAFDELDIHILAVISNHHNLESLVEKFDIPFHFVSHEGKTREAHEAAIQIVLKEYKPEFLVLAKYMRVLTPDFIGQYPNRVINIHHSFLPAFTGANPYVQAYERGVKIIGATAHFVTSHLDEGPIIAQSVIPVAHTHNATEMAQAGRDVEKTVLARALKLVTEDRVFVYKNRTIIFD